MTATKPVLCIYHGNCADGFTAAWVVRRYYRDQADFHPGVYNDPPPPVDGRHVVLVDFSYPRDVLIEMSKTARLITILDHHKSAMIDLQGLQDVLHCPLQMVFDMGRSGARITWDWFFPSEAAPTLLLHIEDRDLWRFALPQTREIQATVFSYPYDFAVWDMLMAADLSALAAEGAAIERKHHKDVAELTRVVTRLMCIGGYTVPVANLPYTLVSDAAHLLAKDAPFAACYWDTPAGRVFGLRSTAGGVDVSEVAKLYGGGGHAHAAGFRISLDRAAELEVHDPAGPSSLPG